jgi:hypothetical protein
MKARLCDNPGAAFRFSKRLSHLATNMAGFKYSFSVRMRREKPLISIANKTVLRSHF